MPCMRVARSRPVMNTFLRNMRAISRRTRWWLAAGVCGLPALLLRGWLAPAYALLPADYAAEAVYIGQGRFWLEPLSGVLVDHEVTGVSYFVAATSGQRVGEPIIEWSQR